MRWCRLCRSMDGHTLMGGLKGVSEEVREVVFAGFPVRRAGVLGDTTLPAVGPVSSEEILEARRQVVEAANIMVELDDMLR